MDESADYCRQVEAYLCQKNGGHLVRIVGPAFETVRGWAAQGVPLKVAFKGIDRCCERANAKGGRRRPMRIEFCEADVLEAFDDWRRAVGVSATQVAETPAAAADWAPRSKTGSLAAHIERSLSRLLAPPSNADAAYDDAVRGIVHDLDELAARAKGARGEARTAIVEQLADLDRRLLEAARRAVDPRTAEALRIEAEAELAGFAARMPAPQRERTIGLACDRLLREALNLPVLAYE